MAGKKLESFKISETRRPAVASPRKPASVKKEEPAHPESRSLGFARIEKILENEDAASVSQHLGKILHDVEAYDAKATTNKAKAAAKKAVVALERTADLMEYLFQTKAALIEQAKKP